MIDWSEIKRVKQIYIDVILEVVSTDEVINKILDGLKEYGINESKQEIVELIQDGLEEQLMY